jgi:DNA polymerase I-like protein with 3'-5' exonuclease and polymerase domains
VRRRLGVAKELQAVKRAAYVPPKLEDTLIAHHDFASHLPKSLAHVTSVYCTSRPWKLLAGKGATGEKGLAPWELVEKGPEGIEELLKYNGSDALLTRLCWDRMQADLKPERHTYESDKRIAQMCRRMTETGIGFDVAARQELSKHLRARKRGLLAAMRDYVGKASFHPVRHNDVRSAIFGRFKAPLLRPTPTGLASTNNETLEWLKAQTELKASHLADLVLRWRATDKTLGSYVDNVDFQESEGGLGRVHPPWKLGPVTGRLSCWLMTLPKYGDDWETHVRRLYVADPRSKRCRLVAQIHDAAIFEVEGRFVYYDLSQAELRCAAFFSGDEALIEACKSDVHTENAKVVFEGIAETMKRLARANEPSPFLDENGKAKKWKAVTAKQGGCKDERDIAKNCSFCVTYEGSAERAYITLQAAGNKKVTMGACEELVRRFHSRYKQYYRYIDTNEDYCRERGHLRSVLAGRIRWLGWYAPRTEIANFPIQSGIADVHNERLPVIEERCRKMTRVDDVKKVITEVWQEPIKVPHNGVSFIMPIDLKDGSSWSNLG